MSVGRTRRFAVYDGLVLLETDDVRPHDRYSEFLAESLPDCAGLDALDATVGGGLHALVMARTARSVVALDLSPQAVDLTRRNYILNGVECPFDVKVSDVFSALSADHVFDLIVAWPPLMPGPPEATRAGHSVANDGGPSGRLVLDRLIVGARSHLREWGTMWTLHPWYLDLGDTMNVAERSGLQVQVGESRRFPMGTISTERLGYIERLGRHPIQTHRGLEQEMTLLTLSGITVGHRADDG